jgi:hypothetical protein
MRKDEKPASANAFSVADFCRRNAISVTTVYLLKRQGKLKIEKILGKAVVLAEDEQAFLQAVRAGKLASPVEKGAGRGKRAKAQQPGTAA